MQYEKTRKGNPFGLTINQHIHSCFCISKFTGKDNKVEVFFKERNTVFRIKPDDPRLCLQRCWDQRTEQCFMLRIENKFHSVVEMYSDPSRRDHNAISLYCALWRARSELINSSPSDVHLIGISNDNLSKEQEEILESKGVLFIRENGMVPSRFSIGLNLQQRTDQLMSTLGNIQWGLLTASSGEFIAADGYGDMPYIPISPTHAFFPNCKDTIISRDNVIELNKESISRSKLFYLSKSLQNCPVH